MSPTGDGHSSQLYTIGVIWYNFRGVLMDSSFLPKIELLSIESPFCQLT
jgi:hypothetical protein